MEDKKNLKSRLSGLKNRLKDWMTHNAVLKVISVLVAIAIWLGVTNTTNPEISSTIKTGISVVNADELTRADKIFSLDTKNVNITYRIRSVNKNLVKSSDFKAYVDMSDYSITGAVPVYVTVSEEASSLVSEVTYDPIVVHVTTDNIIRRKFPINANLTGTAADGYVLGGITCSPDIVYITGSASEVGKVESVSFSVDADGASRDIYGQEKLALYDAAGNKITPDVELSTGSYIAYQVKVYRKKSITVKAAVSGTPGEGFVLDSIETDPTFISVYGSDDALEGLSYINIPRYELNIEGAVENKTFNLNIEDYLPEGVYLSQGSSQLVLLVKLRSVTQIPSQSAVIISPIPVGSGPAAGTGSSENIPETSAASLEETEAVPEDETAEDVFIDGEALPEDASEESGESETHTEYDIPEEKIESDEQVTEESTH